MKKTILSFVVLVIVACLPLKSHSIELTPYVDGTYWDQPCTCSGSSHGCFLFYTEYCPCMPYWCDALSTNSLSVHDYCGPCGTYQEVMNVHVEDRERDLLEFDISSARGLFDQNNMKATLRLTVNTVIVGTGRLYLYDTADQYEDGSLLPWDTGSQITWVYYSSPLQSGDTVTFDVTNAVKHDLFDTGQTDYSGFSLSTIYTFGIDCTFYTLTSTAYSPKLIIEQATLVTLSTFKAQPKSGKIVLSWTTEAEIDNAGFNLFRAEAENGEYIKINSSLISAKGSPTTGTTYQFIDENVRNRTTYFYKLEDVDLIGTSTTHGPVSARPRMMIGTGR